MPNAAKVVLYGTQSCGYCIAARKLLSRKGVDFEDILVSGDDAMRRELERLSGAATVPQIFINDKAVGGFDELYELDEDGDLDALLAPA